jgi:hypothetical protein
MAQQIDFSSIGCAHVKTPSGIGEPNRLRGFEVRDIGVLALLVDAIDSSAIAGGREQPLRSLCQRIDDVVMPGPDFVRRSLRGNLVDL